MTPHVTVSRWNPLCDSKHSFYGTVQQLPDLTRGCMKYFNVKSADNDIECGGVPGLPHINLVFVSRVVAVLFHDMTEDVVRG